MSVLLNESVTVTGEIPLLFLDFDGVMNPLNRYPKWIGEGKPTELDYALPDPCKWEHDTIDISDAEHFKPDNEKVVEFHGRNITVHWSSELVKRLNDFAADGKVQIIWLTAWKERTDYLSELLGLNIPAGSWMDYPQRGGGFSGKAESIHDLYDILRVKPPFMWVDDVETHSFANVWNSENNFFPKRLEVEALIIETFNVYGVSREEMDLLEAFVK